VLVRVPGPRFRNEVRGKPIIPVILEGRQGSRLRLALWSGGELDGEAVLGPDQRGVEIQHADEP
jgi:hypothetical protein